MFIEVSYMNNTQTAEVRKLHCYLVYAYNNAQTTLFIQFLVISLLYEK